MFSSIQAWLRLVVAACAVALAAVAQAQTADGILSRNVKEADGVTGQDTNDGSGIKTGHLQDGAVTDAKIAGPIAGTKLGPHGHAAADVAGLEAALAAKAPLSHGHATADVVGLDAALAGKASVTHSHDDRYQRKYANVVVVAKSGGDFADPVSAMNAIIGASALNPVLLKIMPGVYDLGTTPLRMKPYVDVEGSGRNVTIIAGSVRGDQGMPCRPGLVTAAAHSELRHLSVRNEVTSPGPNYAACGIWAELLDSSIDELFTFTVDDVDVRVRETGGGFASAVSSNEASIRIRRSFLYAESQGSNTWGIYQFSGYGDVKDTEITVRNDATYPAGYYVLGHGRHEAPGLTSKFENVRVTVEGAASPYHIGVHLASYASAATPVIFKDVVFALAGTAPHSYALVTENWTAQLKCIDVFDRSYARITNAHDGNWNPYPCPTP